MYDWRELQRWNISEALLPLGSIVQFREPTVWQQYRLQLIGALAVVLFQAAMIAGLLFERRARKRATEQADKARVETGLHRESPRIWYVSTRSARCRWRFRTRSISRLSLSRTMHLRRADGSLRTPPEAQVRWRSC